MRPAAWLHLLVALTGGCKTYLTPEEARPPQRPGRWTLVTIEGSWERCAAVCAGQARPGERGTSVNQVRVEAPEGAARRCLCQILPER